MLAIPVFAQTIEDKNTIEVENIVVTKLYPEHITENKQYAYDKVLEEWSVEQWKYFDDLIHRESTWNNLAQNPNSTAFGYGQFLNSTWELVGCKKTTDPDIQIDCTIKYIKAIYGTPQKAIVFHNANNYY